MAGLQREGQSTRTLTLDATGDTARITGTGVANGAPVTFTVEATDKPDRFAIRLSNGYAADSPLKQGRIEIRDRWRA